MTSRPARDLQLPSCIGFGWLDVDSIRTADDVLHADYGNGEDLIYRIECDPNGAWSISEFLDLVEVGTATGTSLSEAVGALVSNGSQVQAHAPSVERLLRQVRDRAHISFGSANKLVDMWNLSSFALLAVYKGVGRPPAPDFRPKSYHARRGRAPRWNGSFVFGYSHGLVRDDDSEQRDLPCTVVSYRTAPVNVTPVLDALLEDGEFPRPWRLVVHTGPIAAGVLQCESERERPFELDLRDA